METALRDPFVLTDLVIGGPLQVAAASGIGSTAAAQRQTGVLG